ncbi:DUF3750 domain-containing protein [Rhodopseudomonas palustris]|uniref:DUF3750 domain-containing protein n=1 Tax=Rhodopseudomonas palustris TaxID=1076 RepID=UPI002ACDB81C|nr:DUF3750 domain-containing protein [Rhodopseudomonas palustris]WQH01365.1 DUF3750 domain-containing protein [Rhodopseudomonas palustris]
MQLISPSSVLSAPHPVQILVRRLVILLLLLLIVPIVVSAGKYALGDRSVSWQAADRSSAGLLPPAAAHPEALVRVFAARTVRWRGIFAVHSWIVVKPANATRYTRYDYTAWGEPVRVNGFVADGRWFGDEPQLIAAADGEAAASMIPKIEAAIKSYKLNAYGDYRAWPGPNSNTFVAAALAAVPELKTTLPPTAIGKDYPWDGGWIGWTPSGTGIRATLGGYCGLTLGWIEGVELNLFGAVLGLDLRRPAIKLPGLGRIGLSPI